MNHPLAPVQIDDPLRPAAARRGTSKGLRDTSILIAKCVVTGASLWWVGRVVEPRAVLATLAAASTVLLGISLVFFLLMAVLGGLRWWVLLRAMSQPQPAGALISLFWTGMVLNQMLPSAAGDTVRVWLAVRRGCALRAAINSIVLDRVLMLAALLLIVLATQPLLKILVPSSPPWWVPALLATAAVVGVALLSVADVVTARLPAWPPLRWIGLLGTDTRAVTASAWGLPAAVLCLLGNLNFVAAGATLGAALGLAVPLQTYLAIIPLVVVVTVLPISIAGWGLREGLLVSLFAHAGVNPGAALAYSLMFGVFSAAGSLPGLIFWWLQPDRAATKQLV
jgi:hypothetical protein